MASGATLNLNDIVSIIQDNTNFAKEIADVIVKSDIKSIRPSSLKTQCEKIVSIYDILLNTINKLQAVYNVINPEIKIQMLLSNLNNNINELKHPQFGLPTLIINMSELMSGVPALKYKLIYKFSKTLTILRQIISDINEFVKSMNTTSIAKIYYHNHILGAIASMSTALSIAMHAITSISGGVMNMLTLEWQLSKVGGCLSAFFAIMDVLNDYVRDKYTINKDGEKVEKKKSDKFATAGELKKALKRTAYFNVIIYAIKNMVLAVADLGGLKMWWALRKFRKKMAKLTWIIRAIKTPIKAIVACKFTKNDIYSIIIFGAGVFLLRAVMWKLGVMAILATLLSPIFLIGIIAMVIFGIFVMMTTITIDIITLSFDSGTSKKVIGAMKNVALIMLGFAALAATIALLVAATPKLLPALGALLLLILTLGIIYALIRVIRKEDFGRKRTRQKIINNIIVMMIVAGMLVGLQAALLAIGVLAIPLMLMWPQVMLTLLMLTGFVLGVAVLGKMMTFVFPMITAFMTGMYLITLSVGAILATAVMLLILGAIEFNEETRRKIKENVAMIVGTVYDIVFMVFENGYKISKPKESDGTIKRIFKSLLGSAGGFVSMLFASGILIAGVFSVFAILLMSGMLKLIGLMNFDKDEVANIKANVKLVINTALDIISELFDRDSNETQNTPDSRGWLDSILNSNFVKGISNITSAILAVGFLALSIVTVGLIMILSMELKLLAKIEFDPTGISLKVKEIIDSATSIIQAIFGTKDEPKESGSKRKGIMGAISWLCDSAGNLFKGIGKIATILATMGFVAMTLISVGMLFLITKQLEYIKKIDFKPAEVKANINLVLNTAQEVIKALNDKEFTSDLDKVSKRANKIDNILSSIKKASDIMGKFTKISDKEVENNTKVIGNYIKYLDKVNSIKVENVKSVTNLFEKMAQFSKSINGDFNRLADALNEKIAPLLAELKRLMEGLPKHMETSSNTISQTIVDNSPAIGYTPSIIQRNADNTGNSDNEKWKEEQRQKAIDAKEEQAKISNILNEIMEILTGAGAYADGVKTH